LSRRDSCHEGEWRKTNGVYLFPLVEVILPRSIRRKGSAGATTRPHEASDELIAYIAQFDLAQLAIPEPENEIDSSGGRAKAYHFALKDFANFLALANCHIRFRSVERRRDNVPPPPFTLCLDEARNSNFRSDRRQHVHARTSGGRCRGTQREHTRTHRTRG
jgi:hypothetical protein